VDGKAIGQSMNRLAQISMAYASPRGKKKLALP
jgi:hypothetical protein